MARSKESIERQKQYNRDNYVYKPVNFGKNDFDLIEYVEALPNFTDYVRNLIMEDMKKNGNTQNVCIPQHSDEKSGGF